MTFQHLTDNYAFQINCPTLKHVHKAVNFYIYIYIYIYIYKEDRGPCSWQDPGKLQPQPFQEHNLNVKMCFSFWICIRYRPSWSLLQKNAKLFTTPSCEPFLLRCNWTTSQHFEAIFNLTPFYYQLRWLLTLFFANRDGYNWTASSEFGTYSLCEQRRFRRACASAQSRQNLRCSHIQAVSQEEPSDRKPDPWPLWMAGHAQLKFVMTECSKTQIRLTGLNSFVNIKVIKALSIWLLLHLHNRPSADYRPHHPPGNFVHYNFLKIQYISHKMRHDSPLRVEALSCNNNITYVIL